MPLYISDYLVDTMNLNAEQHGGYLLLLMAAWKSDAKLANDGAELQQIARMTPQQWARNELTLRKFFHVTPEFWIHNRVRAELDNAKAMVDKKSAAGRRGAEAKWGLRVV